MDLLKQTSFTQNKLSLFIRIENFPTFVTSKAKYISRYINVNNTQWCIHIWLTDGTYNNITQASSDQDQPKFLFIGVCGKVEKSLCKECSFNVTAKFALKQHATATTEATCKLCFNASNQYKNGFSLIKLKLDVTFYFILFSYFFRIFKFHLGVFNSAKWLFG